MEPAKPRARIDSLDALRGLCALSVALYHFETSGMLSNAPFFRHSWMLVDFFFVLSGFVITAAYADTLRRGFSIPRFLLLRLARIWPLHVLMLLCFLCLELSKLVVQVGPAMPLFAPPRELGSFVMNLFLLQVFGIYDHLTWNVPSWSIAAEFWVYVIAAIIFRFVGSGRTALFVAIAGLSGAVMVLAGPPFLNLAHDGGVIRCIYGFSIGAVTCSAFAAGAGRLLGARPAADVGRARASLCEIAVVAGVVAAISFASSSPLTVAMPPLFGVCVLVLARQGGVLSAALSRRFPVWLGSISYSIYMTHAFIEGRVLDVLTISGKLLGVTMVERSVVDGVAKRVLVGSEVFVDLTVLTLFLLIIAVSHASYRYVEQPCNAWARSRIGRRSPRAEMVPAS